MPALLLCEPTTADEVRKNNRKVRDRLRARFREQVCLMKDLDLDNTTLAACPNDSAAAKFQQAVAESPPVVAPQAAVIFVQNNAPWNDDTPIFPFLTIKKIIFVVGAFYEIKPIDLVSHRREWKIMRPRQIVAYLAKELTPFSLPKIGKCLGDRDHTTIWHAVHKIESLVAQDRELADEVGYLRNTLEFGSIPSQKLSGASSSAP